MAASEKVCNLTEIAARVIAEKLGTDIVALDMTEQSLLSEVFLIATAANERQVEAIADAVMEKLTEHGERPLRAERSAQWVLLDYSDLVIHIQSKELRQYYLLDRLWNDCPRIPLDISEER
jgi:ribosome-associated protein